MNPQNVLLEDDYRRVRDLCNHLLREASARVVFLIDRNGQVLAQAGDASSLDTTSLASLTAGNMAATGGLARLLGEREFPHLFHEGERESLHISLVGSEWILVVIFDDRSSLGLVRLRVRKVGEALSAVAADVARRAGEGRMPAPFLDITDEEIENLFAQL